MANTLTPQASAQPTQGTPEAAPQAMISGDALQGLVQSAVQGVIDAERGRVQAQQREREAAQQARQQQGTIQQDPVFQTIAPIVAPAINAVSLKADNALDAVTFYGSTPEAAKYRQEIEALVNGEIARGRPTDRQSMWWFFRGNPANAKRLQEDYDAQQKMIEQQSATLGAGVMGRGDGSTLTFKPDTPLAEMRDALKGVSF